MDRNQQMQAIILRLTGVPAASPPAGFELDEPWRSIFRRVRGVSSREEAVLLLAEAVGADGASLFAELLALLPGDGAFATPSVPAQDAGDPAPDAGDPPRYPSLRDMPPDLASVQWLWPSWIPRGMVTLLAAAPGVGKSLVALDLARRIIRGEPFPDGAPVPHPGSPVLLVDAEGAPGLLRQRVDAWQVDPGLLYLMADPSSVRPVDLGTLDDMGRLLDMCLAIRPALVIVDSLASAAPRSETSLKAAHHVLGSLSMVAHKLGPALLVIHHLRKRAAAGAAPYLPSASDLRGSSHLTATARSVLMLSPEAAPSLSSAPDPNGPRRLALVKSNLCPLPPPLCLALEQHPGAPLLHYSPLVEAPPPPTHLGLCAGWLLGFLAAAPAPVRPADVVTTARRAGFSRPTLYRARQALGPAILDVGGSPHDPRKRWSLAP